MKTTSIDNVLWYSLVIHFTTFVAMMARCNPSTVVATGIHQTYGECGVKARDMMGFVREEFLCEETYDEDFHFDCVDQDLPPAHAEWYTLCGTPHADYSLSLSVESALAFVGLSVYAVALSRPRNEEKKDL